MTSVEIEGFIKGEHPFVFGFFCCRQLGLSGVARFMIDLGSTRTTILEGDAVKMGIDFKKLKKSKEPTQITGGELRPYVIPKSFLLFENKKGKYHFEPLDELEVIKPKRGKLKPDFSILGIDVIRRFNFNWDRNGKPTLKK